MTRGRFITLEGIEGAGKSTVASLVRDWLTERGIRVRLTREPGGTALAERVRDIVLERGAEAISPVSETLLMFAARGIHTDNLIRPALADGTWVVCDRYTDATRAYQGAGRGIDPEWIEQLARAVQSDLEPDFTLLLDLPVAAALARARSRSGVAADRIEAEHAEFFAKVRAGYLQLAQQHTRRVRLIDASGELATVIAQVHAELSAMISEV